MVHPSFLSINNAVSHFFTVCRGASSEHQGGDCPGGHSSRWIAWRASHHCYHHHWLHLWQLCAWQEGMCPCSLPIEYVSDAASGQVCREGCQQGSSQHAEELGAWGMHR